jgi:Uma2 family endonuclease
MSSLEFDRGPKLQIYADAGIPEYWIANLVDRQIELFRSPRPKQDDTPAGYAESIIVPANGTVEIRIEGKVVGTILAAALLA